MSKIPARLIPSGISFHVLALSCQYLYSSMVSGFKNKKKAALHHRFLGLLADYEAEPVDVYSFK
ncbi:MAG: hypothetical protein H6Q13_3555, partial [Bacteroidetes bacterium]|nr:hypothetical protein [Bacteroidota bacterium]